MAPPKLTLSFKRLRKSLNRGDTLLDKFFDRPGGKVRSVGKPKAHEQELLRAVLVLTIGSLDAFLSGLLVGGEAIAGRAVAIGGNGSHRANGVRLTCAVVIQAWSVFPVPVRKSGSPDAKPRKRSAAIFGWTKTRTADFDCRGFMSPLPVSLTRNFCRRRLRARVPRRAALPPPHPMRRERARLPESRPPGEDD